MAGQTNIIAYMTRRFDERGAVMTEFVILLPVFVLLFVGIVELNRLQRSVNRAHIKANQYVWVGTTQIEESTPDSKWGDPKQVEVIAPEPDPDNCDPDDDGEGNRFHECAGFDWNKYKRLNDYGTFGEAISASDFETVRDYLDRQENIANILDDEEVDQRMYESVYDDGEVWGAYALIATWDRHHNADDLIIPPSWPANAFPQFDGAEITGFREANGAVAPLVGGKKSAFAYAAGTRYGLVISNTVEEETIGSGTYTSEVEFQTLAPPRTMEKDDEAMFTVGTSRLLMRGTGFERIPGFEAKLRLAGFNIGELEE